MIYTRVKRFLSEQMRLQASQFTGGAAIGSTIGRVRKENQDRAIVAEFLVAERPELNRILLVVCDGLGGMADGSLAAEISIASMVSSIFDSVLVQGDVDLVVAAERANRDVFKELKGKGGSTLVAVLLERSRSRGVSIGDSRVYATDKWRKLLQLTKDDNLGALANVPNGLQVDPSQASHLTQFVGMGDGIAPNAFLLSEDTDRILLMSDGVHGCGAVLKEYVSRIEDDLSLVQALLVAANHLGGNDNATLLVSSLPITRPPVDTEKGMVIRLTSPFAKLEIWLPEFGGKRPQVSADETESVERKIHSRAKKSKGMGKRSRQKKQKREPGMAGRGELILDFPEKE